MLVKGRVKKCLWPLLLLEKKSQVSGPFFSIGKSEEKLSDNEHFDRGTFFWLSLV
jgi:hypothetical protein